MIRASRLIAATIVFLWVPPSLHAAQDATLFRVFFVDGTSVVSYGELARVDDQVIFSLPAGGATGDPRLHPVTVAASLVDWRRTDKHAASTRYQQYMAQYAEADYQRLSDEVAAVLNQIALSTDRPRALALAERARLTLAEWPRSHFGYRQDDVREIVTLIDAAVSRLKGSDAQPAFDLTLVAMVEPLEIESLATMPAPRQQLDQLLQVLKLAANPTDRVALLQSALALLADRGAGIDTAAVADIRRSLERQLRLETTIDLRYTRLTQQVLANATRAAVDARVSDVQRLLERIPKEDARLGRQRPQVIQALATAVQVQLDRARRLRLLRDQWTVRRSLFRDYQRRIGSEMVQLVKAQPSLEAIRKLEGPEPDRLASLRLRLSGGATRLERIRIPDYLRSTHDLVVSAWRFAENAANARFAAVSSGNLTTAWEASSAAAGALMMLTRAQQEIQALLEPPKLQ
jgi:hypothetical protein